MKHPKILLGILIVAISSVAFSQQTPPSIAGAFGINLGEKFDAATGELVDMKEFASKEQYMLSTLEIADTESGGNGGSILQAKIYKITPTKPSNMFSSYYVFTTWTTSKAYGVLAVSSRVGRDEFPKSKELLMGVISGKYGDAQKSGTSAMYGVFTGFKGAEPERWIFVGEDNYEDRNWIMYIDQKLSETAFAEFKKYREEQMNEEKKKKQAEAQSIDSSAF